MLKKRAVGEAAQELVAGVRFLWRLPAFLRHPIDPERARAILRRRLETRETGFLDLARRAIFDQRVSPYRRLLAAAGFEYGDLERLVHRDGVDTALEVLLRHGVYLRVDEFKGRRAAARGGRTIDVRPSDLRNPFLRVDMLSQTGGSGGPSTPVAMDLGFIGEMAVNYSLVNQARGAEQWVHAVWLVPSGDAIVKILRQTRCGPTPVRWFSQLPLAAVEVHPRYRWGARLLRYAGTLARVPLPWPEHVPIEHPAPIVEWMHGVLRAGRTPHLMTIASSAVHVCRAAAEVGVDLRGAQFTLTGEPTTPARLAALRDVGAVAYPFYATTEAGLIGLGCLTPETPDDVHLFHDRVAVIKSAEASAAEGLPTDALYVSSLRVTGSAVILLNVSLGDCAVLTSRRCGCPLESLGWNRHLHTIRSYEKLTAGGMTFLDSDLVRVLEELLPRRFGGGPADYQLVEEELEDGRPRLRLLVHPSVGGVDEQALGSFFLSAIATGPEAQALMTRAWRDAKLLRVERRPPFATSAGKILHLHVDRNRQPTPYAS